MPFRSPKLALLQGEDMLEFRHGNALYSYCTDCIYSSMIPPPNNMLGCTKGDDPDVKEFSDQAEKNQVYPETQKCPGYVTAEQNADMGGPREAARAALVKDISVELRPHTENDWEEHLDTALDELASSDPQLAAVIRQSVDNLSKREHESLFDPAQEYDYVGPYNEKPSGVPSRKKRHPAIDGT